jgi:branched-chain amino acid transport system permease protein
MKRLPSWAMVPVIAVLGIAFFAIATVSGQSIWIDIGSRVLVYGLAAASLDLLVGYAGMVSFGHAMFLLCGGYAVGILAREGWVSGFMQWPVAMGASAALALLLGPLVLRTGGVYFILLTLAFSQMLFFVFTGLSAYGGDEGLQVYPRSEFVFGLDLNNPTTLYFVVLATACCGIYCLHRFTQSPFGLVLKGCRQNEPRMRALGYETFKFKLIAFVVAAAVCGLAGALLANVTGFVSPEYGSWHRSGELLVMVIFGGMGTIFGPVFGAIVILVLENVISEQTEHWPLILGAAFLAVALYLPNGLRSLFGRSSVS